MQNIPLYIGNKPFPGSGKKFNNYNPGTGDLLNEVTSASQEDFE